MKTVVCICTYRRPEGLARLLDALAKIASPADLQIVVVDNDPGGAGLAVALARRNRTPWPLRAVASTASGISGARNRAVNEALALDPDFLAFIDDDEWPSPAWLEELHRVALEHDADAVGGPTRPAFPEHYDGPLRDNPYYGADMRLTDGAACRLQAAGNVLVRASVLQSLVPDVFHPDFAFSGGEDLAFFSELHRRGARMHWAAGAVVHESVPPGRMTEAWLRERVVTVTNSRVRVDQRYAPSWVASALRVAKTTALGAHAAAATAASRAGVGSRDAAALLRWKFAGKLRAHLGRIDLRRDEA